MPEEIVPILYAKDARETAKWYARLGFELEGERQFAPGMPYYLFLARGGIHLHLSEHRGDAKVGTLMYFYVHDVDSIAADFGVKVIDQPWAREVHNVLGFAAKGTVTASDYESVMIPVVEAFFSRQSKVRFLYHLGEDFSGFEAAAMWDDMKLGLKHISGWERLAVATDVEWIRAAIKIFRVAIPGHVRLFHNSELAEAKRWITE